MNKDIDINVKWAVELSDAEIEEMSDIICSYDSGLPREHLQNTHIERHNPLFIIAYSGKRIISFQCHSIYYETTPFHKKPLPIILAGAAYHVQDIPKMGLANKMSNLFLKQCFGRFWFLKKIVVIADTVNPKSLRAMDTILGNVYPNIYNPTPESVCSFTRHIMKKYYGQQVEVDKYLVMKNAHQYDGLTDITDPWNTMYKTKYNQYQTYYLDQGIIKQFGNKYFIGGDSIVALSYFTPTKLIGSYLKQFFIKKPTIKNGMYWWQKDHQLFKI